MTAALVRFGRKPDAVEDLFEVVRVSELGEYQIRLPDRSTRWVPAHWVLEVTD